MTQQDLDFGTAAANDGEFLPTAFLKIQENFDDVYAHMREKLTADRTYYVRTDGSDTNDGLTNTAGGAFLTPQKAIDVVSGLDVGGYDVTIQLADATWANGTDWFRLKEYAGTTASSRGVKILGNRTTPANVNITATGAGGAFGVDPTGMTKAWHLDGFKVSHVSGSGTRDLIDIASGVVYIGKVEFGASNRGHVSAAFKGLVYFLEDYAISGGGAFHLFTYLGGTIRHIGADYAGMTITITGTPAFSDAFAKLQGGIIEEASWGSYSGSATGVRYSVTLNGVVNTFGGGANWFPGNSGGSTATGGQYV